MHELSADLTAFVQEQELLRIAFLDSQGYPRVVPLWFVVLDGQYFVGTGTASAKWKALERDARIGWVIDGGQPPHYRGVSLRGQAQAVTARPLRERISTSLSVKYFGVAAHPQFIEIYGAVDDPQTVYLHLEPNDGISWAY